MDTYSILRQLADSWGLLAMFAFFVGVVIWAFRPGSTRTYEDTAAIPFRYEDRPAPPREAGDQTRDAGDEEAGR